MKKLIMFLLVHINPNAIFSQVADTTAPLRQFSRFSNPTRIDLSGYATGKAVSMNDFIIKPDTLRAICLITLGYRQQGIAHARMGFVVIEPGKRPVYLDCRKRALKLPQVGWGFREVGVNEKLKQ